MSADSETASYTSATALSGSERQPCPIIGMDPHKRSATIGVMTGDQTVLGRGPVGTDRDGYTAMLAYAKQWPSWVWAIEGSTSCCWN
jgi:hypothetical protein